MAVIVRVMRSGFARLLAVVLLFGQLQVVPAAVACAREHRQPASHCGDSPGTNGPAVLPAQDAAGGLCATLGPCAVPTPVVAPAIASSDFAFAVLRVVAPGASTRPASLDLAPLAPPPQA